MWWIKQKKKKKNLVQAPHLTYHSIGSLISDIQNKKKLIRIQSNRLFFLLCARWDMRGANALATEYLVRPAETNLPFIKVFECAANSFCRRCMEYYGMVPALWRFSARIRQSPSISRYLICIDWATMIPWSNISNSASSGWSGLTAPKKAAIRAHSASLIIPLMPVRSALRLREPSKLSLCGTRPLGDSN